MRFVKVGLLFATATLSRLIGGLFVVKIIAVQIGTDGLGQLGQFMSLMTIVTIVAGGGISSGIIKYVAEVRSDRTALVEYMGAASVVGIAACLLLGSVLLLGAPWLSVWLFGSDAHADVIRVLAFGQIAIAAVNLLLGLLNGHTRVVAFASISAISAIAGALGVAVGCHYFGLKGAMYGLIWMPACSILLLLPWYRWGLRMHWRDLAPRWDRAKINNYLGFSLMLLSSAVTVQLAQIIARNIIGSNDGWAGVGYWQATTKISDAYLLFITVVLANYYLPRLAALTTRESIKVEVMTAYKLAIPVLIVMSLSVYFARDWLILLLFSPDFSPMREFFTWQLLGDAFKIAAYIGGYVAVARASTKLYIGAEIFQAGMFVLLCYFFVGKYGAIGATYAYFTNYVLYFLVVQFALRLYFKPNSQASL